MNEYEQSLRIRASADTVFRYAADVANLPRYLPTTREARAEGGGRVVVAGEAHGRRYEAEGFLLGDPERHRLVWGSEEGNYSGWMQVVDTHEGGAVVTVHLSLQPRLGDGAARAPDEAAVEHALLAALESIRAHVEVDRPTYLEEPRAAT